MKISSIWPLLIMLAWVPPLLAQQMHEAAGERTEQLNTGAMPHRMPPAEAYAACNGKQPGEQAQFVDPGGEILHGTCEASSDGLVLRPDRSDKGGEHRPPPEAYAACEGRSEGTEAQMTAPSGEVIAGLCEPEEGRLVLRPYRNAGRRTATDNPGKQTGKGAGR